VDSRFAANQSSVKQKSIKVNTMSDASVIRSAQDAYDAAVQALSHAQRYESNLSIHFGAYGERAERMFETAREAVDKAKQAVNAADSALNQARAASIASTDSQ
jgi:hypothetical protein